MIRYNKLHNPFSRVWLILVILCLGGPGMIWGASSWNNPKMDIEQGQAKIRIRGKIRKIPLFHLTQKNCIFMDAEKEPQKWTSSNYKRSDCIALRNKRVHEFSDGKNPPAETKLFHVPANQYFKVKMTISEKMANRNKEKFGFQIVKKGEGSKTKFIVGGWKVGETKITKAIKLKPGQYYWRCPQNPTAWYGMIAQ